MLKIAALRDPHRVQQRFRQLSPDLAHLLEGLEVELIGGVPHPVDVLDVLSGPDTKENIVRRRVLAPQVVRVVRARESESRSFSQSPAASG